MAVEKTYYGNEGRVRKADGTYISDWEDCCAKQHATLYEAMACQDRAIGLFNGTVTPEGLAEHALAAYGRKMRTRGDKIEMRTIIFTLTKEPVDAVDTAVTS